MPLTPYLPDRMCGVCGIPLTQHYDGLTKRWSYEHPTPNGPGHEMEPVPIDPSRVRYQCDGCNAPDPEYVATCVPFSLPEPGNATYVDDGEWWFCEFCVSFIQDNDWDGLTSWSLKGNHDDFVTTYVKRRHEALRANLVSIAKL